MLQMGHLQTFALPIDMSELPSEADIGGLLGPVGLGPRADLPPIKTR
jgi:hypothetical protein